MDRVPRVWFSDLRVLLRKQKTLIAWFPNSDYHYIPLCIHTRVQGNVRRGNSVCIILTYNRVQLNTMLLQHRSSTMHLCQQQAHNACVPAIQPIRQRTKLHNHLHSMSHTSPCRLHVPSGLRKSRVSVSTEGSSVTTTQEEQAPSSSSNAAVHTDALIIGGGPAGLSAAIMLAKRGWSVTVAGGQQIHRFTGGSGPRKTDTFCSSCMLAPAPHSRSSSMCSS